MTRPALDRLLAPRSVAVLGASDRPGSFGERLTLEALRSPGVARVELVNPRYPSVQGRPCADSVADLGQPVDLVLCGVPDPLLPDQLAAAAAAGAGGAVVFGSAAGLGARLRDAAGPMAVCGAGCMGFANVTDGVRALGYLEREPLEPGGITLVTHSGSVFSALLRTHRRLDYRLVVSSGQELVTGTGDYLQWALAQGDTTVVGLFLETIRDADALRRGLALAAADDVPVVALTVGGSPTGRAMVSAHSGAVAGSDAAWEALFTAYGVHRTRDMEEFVDTLELFSVGRRVTSPRAGIATVHDSGAERVLVADVAAEEGVPFAPLSEETRARLAARLDAGLAVDNPLDAWGRGADTEDLFTGCLGDLAADDGVDVVALAVDLVAEYDGDDSYPRAAIAGHAATGKPVVVLSSVAAAVDQVQADALRRAGIPVLEGARSGLRALRHLREHAIRGPDDPTPIAPASVTWPAEPLDAVASLELMAAAGLRTVPTASADSLAGALEAAERLGYPVVLKTDAPGVAHRARVGGVRLDLADPAALAAAYGELAASLGPRVAVQPLLTGSAEVALGLLRDPQLGLLVLLARGGTDIESLAQRVVALPARTRGEAAALVARFASLVGVLAPAEELTAAVGAISALAHAAPADLVAIDVNPLLATPAGLVAVDALVERG